MLVTVFKILIILLPLSAFSSEIDEATETIRKNIFLVKGVSESFYERWIFPVRFHLKWQVGQSISRYNDEDRQEIEKFENYHSS